jgi:hypothetical protein
LYLSGEKLFNQGNSKGGVYNITMRIKINGLGYHSTIEKPYCKNFDLKNAAWWMLLANFLMRKKT